MQQARSNNTFALTLIAGLAGALAALLLAPRSGRETRQQLRMKAEDLRDQAAEGIDTARASVEESLARANEVQKRLTDAIKTKRGKDSSEERSNNNTAQDSGSAPGANTWEEEV